MLTRLRVKNFKNLVDVDVHFGPFTCIAGANGVGKSNLLDVIRFLSALADLPLLEAALAIRDQGARTGDIQGLFHHVGQHYESEMSIQAEMIIPESGTDDLGRPAVATSTFVAYHIVLRYRSGDGARTLGSLELVSEELKHITFGKAPAQLPFDKGQLVKNFVKNRRRAPAFISTEGTDENRVINVHQDGGSSGKPQKLKAANLPRTVLSAANSAESPTATLAKREMQSWKMLQLEPAALREPDNFTAPPGLQSDGAHLPATLYKLANTPNSDWDSAAVYAEVANRLAGLIDDVRSVGVDRDESRQLLTLYATGRDGTAYPARALSDGTLRFLALTVLSIDPELRGVICLEEPENGIHPDRIPAMVRLLTDLTSDIEDPSVDGGGLRQVIINTHSPIVVAEVPDDSLVMAELEERSHDGMVYKALQLRGLPGTWRAKASHGGDGTNTTVPANLVASKGQLLAYLEPVKTDGDPRRRRVADRKDLVQRTLPFVDDPA